MSSFFLDIHRPIPARIFEAGRLADVLAAFRSHTWITTKKLSRPLLTFAPHWPAYVHANLAQPWADEAVIEARPHDGDDDGEWAPCVTRERWRDFTRADLRALMKTDPSFRVRRRDGLTVGVADVITCKDDCNCLVGYFSVGYANPVDGEHVPRRLAETVCRLSRPPHIDPEGDGFDETVNRMHRQCRGRVMPHVTAFLAPDAGSEQEYVENALLHGIDHGLLLLRILSAAMPSDQEAT